MSARWAKLYIRAVEMFLGPEIKWMRMALYYALKITELLQKKTPSA
jgi:hypothetical protein